MKKNRLFLSLAFIIISTMAICQKNGDIKKFEIANGVEIEMIWIEPGKFQMGSPADEPERNAEREEMHLVEISIGFWIANTETTQQVWETVTGYNPSKFKSFNHPVEQVSWQKTQEFIKKINKNGARFRLPYEAEWEYACRAGTSTPHAGNLNEMTWHSGNSNGNTHSVRTKKSNAWGIYDMHGNVSELCQDWFTEDITNFKIDPKGPVTGEKKVERGGQFTGRTRHTRSADRSRGLPNENAFYVGFRLVHD